VFYGSPGPAADLSRARSAFGVALEHFAADTESGWRARAQHNFATALSNLGTTAGQLQESVALFELALAWRTAEREIARGVTLHNLGIALRRLAELEAGNRGGAPRRERALPPGGHRDPATPRSRRGVRPFPAPPRGNPDASRPQRR
jgi:hypothetical protein